MHDDYLWDPAARPDPEVQRLERLLGRFRHAGSAAEAPAVQQEAPAPAPRIQRRRLPTLLALAAAVALAVTLLWLTLPLEGPPAAAWQVSRLAGTPAVGASSIGDAARLQVGQWLETDAASRARIAVPGIGFVDVEPGTRIGLLQTHKDQHRLSLEHGKMHAWISAPPRLFYVETPAAVAVDLGCAYTLTVDTHGHGLLQVLAGFVALESHGRESLVTSGALCEMRPGRGPGTPYAADAAPELQQALRRLDFDANGAQALPAVLRSARADDELTLWHLSRSLPPGQAAEVRKRMAELGLDTGRATHWEALLGRGSAAQEALQADGRPLH
jgi:ferric-dicitrate binding protein FerR (iron transport regulator)